MRAKSGLSRVRVWAPAVTLAAAFTFGCSAEQGGIVETDSVVPQAAGISYPVTLRTVVGNAYLRAENGGGREINATSTMVDTWETFTLHDVNSGALRDGDTVTLSASNGQFWSAEQGGGGGVNANRDAALAWERFVIHKAGGGTIVDGDQVSLSTQLKGLYVSALKGGGGQVVADRAAALGWETFVIGLGKSGGGGGSGGSGGGGGGGSGGGGSGGAGGGGGSNSGLKVVAYLPNWAGSFRQWARTIDFNKMTHLNLAFALATGSNGWDLGASDADVRALVDAAHAKGVKVLASLGGAGGDATIVKRYKNGANIVPLVNNLNAFVTRLDLDGVDVDIEDGNNLGASYAAFIDEIVKQLRPKGKLITAAVAQYLQGGMSDATLHSFDFVNIMIYTNYNDSVKQMSYYANTKKVPKPLITLGAAFFGTGGGREWAYSEILKKDPGSFGGDQATVDGVSIHLTGTNSMKRLCDLSKGYGGIMFWELSEDVTDSRSLWKVIQGQF
jgi:hypothetical protein